MFVVVSNTGNWDHDLWGVVGVLPNIGSLPSFIINDEPDTDPDKVEYIFGGDECYASFEANEVNFLCMGNPIAYAIYEPEGCYPSIYYIVDLQSTTKVEHHLEFVYYADDHAYIQHDPLNSGPNNIITINEYLDGTGVRCTERTMAGQYSIADITLEELMKVSNKFSIPINDER